MKKRAHSFSMSSRSCNAIARKRTVAATARRSVSLLVAMGSVVGMASCASTKQESDAAVKNQAANLVAAHSKSSNSSRVESALSCKFENGTLVASLAPGYHFNSKAPSSIQLLPSTGEASSTSTQVTQAAQESTTLRPTSLQPNRIVFSHLPLQFERTTASLYVCDDAESFCENHRVDVRTGKPLVATSASTATDSVAVDPTVQLKGIGKLNKFGFIESDWEKAFALARKKHKRVLADFSARWCPGCLRYETETFATAEWKRLTKNFILLRLDADLPDTEAREEKLRILGIPTLLVMDSDGNEIDRIYDYQPNSVLKEFFAAIADDPTPVSQLALTSTDPKVQLRVGKRLLDTNRFAESATILAKIQPPPPELLAARVALAHADFKADANNKNEYIQALEDAIQTEPSSSRSLTWREELAGVIDDPSKLKELRESGAKAADAMLANPEALKTGTATEPIGEFTGFERFYIALSKASLIDATKPGEAETKAAWQMAAQVGRDSKISPSRRGPALRFLIIAIEAGEFDRAEKFVEAMLKFAPQDPELERRHLKILVELKKFLQAVQLGKKVLAESYGMNHAWVLESLAKAEIGSGDIESARARINSALAEPEMELKPYESIRAKFEKLKASLPAAKNG